MSPDLYLDEINKNDEIPIDQNRIGILLGQCIKDKQVTPKQYEDLIIFAKRRGFKIHKIVFSQSTNTPELSNLRV